MHTMLALRRRSQARRGAWVLPPGQSHAATPGELALELLREKLYRRLNQELPYTLVTALESVVQLAPPRAGLRICVSVTVPNKRVKAMVVGKGGAVIQDYVAGPTQAELARILGEPVALVVSVKVAGN